MVCLRGIADDLPLMEWLTTKIFPAEAKHVSEDFVADGTRHAAAEMIRSGTTCFNDMYFYPEVQANVVKDVGIRAKCAVTVSAVPIATTIMNTSIRRQCFDSMSQLAHHCHQNVEGIQRLHSVRLCVYACGCGTC